ncbi:hypothetical protein [Variovorax paradoxus]|uniref:hypothetical protein n=1 Tax=Variovorax paradoxus TaxID=34073 RepID=UPI0028664132|nr:hypothetical protein [Variovorax paradoxus]MDR6454222.1 hypothetical protein [Variovorax paradoxus]
MELLINLAVAGFCFAYVALSSLRLRRKLLADPFHPQSVYRFLILYVLVYSVFSSDDVEVFHFVTKLTVLLTALFFLVSLDVIGAVVSKKSRAKEFFPEKRSDKFFASAFLGLYIAGWMWRAFALQAGLLYGTFLATQLELSSYGNFVGQLNGLSLLALMGRIIFVQSDRLTKGMLLMIFAEIGWAFMSGSKIAILYVILPVLLIAYRRSWFRVQLRGAVLGGLLALILIQVSFSIVTAYRTSVQQSFASGEGLAFSALAEGITNSVTSLWEPAANVNSDSANSISARLNLANFFGALIEREDLWREPWLGRSYYPIITWWIPRALWPEKPTVSVGAWYGEQVLGWDADSRSEGAITIWGDGLANFGFLGILLATVTWIIFSYFVYERVGGRKKWGLLVLAMIYVRLLLGLEQNIATPLVAFQLQALWIALIWLVFGVLARLFAKRGSV